MIAVVAKEGITADVQHINSLAQIAEYGVLPSPVLMINGEIKAKGRLLSLSEIKKLLRFA